MPTQSAFQQSLDKLAEPRSVVVVIPHSQILTLPTTPVQLLPALAGTTHYREYLGYSLVVNTLAGAYGNLADAATGILDLFVAIRFPGLARSMTSPVTAANLNAAMTGQFWVFSAGKTAENRTAGDQLGYYPEQTIATAVMGTSDLSTIPKLNAALAVSLDNYDGDYATDRGDLSGGHEDNYMQFSVFYRKIPLIGV